MFSKALMFLLFLSIAGVSVSQTYSVHPTKAKREKFLTYLNKTISDGLSTELNSAGEESWISAFYPLQLLQKHNEWIDDRISSAMNRLNERSPEFQKAFLELLFANYEGRMLSQVKNYVKVVKDPVCFAIASEYILRSDDNSANRRWLLSLLRKLRGTDPSNIFLAEAGYNIHAKENFLQKITPFFQKDYLKGNVLVFSLQRKNRDYPGIIIVRDTSGNFLTDSSGNIFYQQQLARSISGLPYYITNGNTPQGLFRLDGFDISRSSTIGPTLNLQMSMPFEISAAHFMKDSTLPGKDLPLEMYKRLLPPELQNHIPLFQSYHAGKLGRNEIIAHGTTIDADWYRNKPWFPFTPGLGCLSAKEIWDENTGTTVYSGQWLIAEAVKKAGGANGYVIVLDINDEPGAVTIEEVLNRMKE